MSWRAKEGGLMKPEGVLSPPAGPELIFHVVFYVLVCFQSKKTTFGKEKLSSHVQTVLLI